VIEEDHDMVDRICEDRGETVAQEFNLDDFDIDLVNPDIRLSAPPQVHFLTLLLADFHYGHYVAIYQ